MNTRTSVAVAGATGRLGSFVCEVIDTLPEFELTATLSSTSAEHVGADAAVLIDVTTPEASPTVVRRALQRGQRVIVGTSGWNATRLSELETQLRELPGAAVLVVPNFSLGSVIGTALARIAAAHFASVEIVESHHAAKLDSPSGTAVRAAEQVAAVRAASRCAPGDAAESRADAGQQPARGHLVAGVPVHSLRMHGVIARQEVHFGGIGEELTITHVTHSQESYRAGIAAALGAIGQLHGLVVGLEHILGLRGAGVGQ